MNVFLRIVEAITRAICRAWFEELRRTEEARVVGGGADVADDVNNGVEDALDRR